MQSENKRSAQPSKGKVQLFNGATDHVRRCQRRCQRRRTRSTRCDGGAARRRARECSSGVGCALGSQRALRSAAAARAQRRRKWVSAPRERGATAVISSAGHETGRRGRNRHTSARRQRDVRRASLVRHQAEPLAECEAFAGTLPRQRAAGGRRGEEGAQRALARARQRHVVVRVLAPRAPRAAAPRHARVSACLCPRLRRRSAAAARRRGVGSSAARAAATCRMRRRRAWRAASSPLHGAGCNEERRRRREAAVIGGMPRKRESARASSCDAASIFNRLAAAAAVGLPRVMKADRAARCCRARA